MKNNILLGIRMQKVRIKCSILSKTIHAFFFFCKHNKGRDSKKKRISILTFSDYDFRIFFKVSVALNKPASRKIAYLQRACPVSAPSHAVVYRWVKHFSCANLQLRRPGVKGGGDWEKQRPRKERHAERHREDEKVKARDRYIGWEANWQTDRQNVKY